MSRTWGYILDAPGRPPLEKQREALRLMGADVGDFGTVWGDKIKRGSTRPRTQLTERNALLGAVVAGDTVAFAAPWCIGLSGPDAEWMLAELAERGVAALVNGDLARIEPGGDRAEMVARVVTAQSVHHVAQSKRRAKKRKAKS